MSTLSQSPTKLAETAGVSPSKIFRRHSKFSGHRIGDKRWCARQPPIRSNPARKAFALLTPCQNCKQFLLRCVLDEVRMYFGQNPQDFDE